jgi:hypothetical protein
MEDLEELLLGVLLTIIITGIIISLDMASAYFVINKRISDTVMKIRIGEEIRIKIREDVNDLKTSFGTFGPELGVAALTIDISAMVISLSNPELFNNASYNITINFNSVQIGGPSIWIAIVLIHLLFLSIIVYMKHLYIDRINALKSYIIIKKRTKYMCNILGLATLISSIVIILRYS